MSKELITEKKLSVIEFMATKYGMEKAAFEAIMKETVMPGNVKNEEFMAFLSVAKEYDLNPLTKQIYALAKGGRVVPIVPVDGWSTILNRNPQFDGAEFVDVVENGKVISVECKIYRKDRSRPISAIEYLEECQVASNPTWKQWPRRMLRHKALIQAARYAFGLGGIYDPDEGERIIKEAIDVTPISKTAQAHAIPPALERSFNVSELKSQPQVQGAGFDAAGVIEHLEETIGEVVTDNSEAIEAAFKKVSEGLKSMITAKAVNMAFDISYKEDIEFLKVYKNDYYRELVAIKSARLEALK